MKLDTTQQKPLYKVLNEQRTQGDWSIDTPRAIIESVGKYIGRFGKDVNSSTNIDANVQYAALAVNNLHHLAEALEETIKSLVALKDGSEWKQWDDLSLKNAKEAMKAIS